MYSMVLMMAVAGSGDASGFGGHKKGCTGCHGEVVVAYAPAPVCCTPAPVGCSGSCRGGLFGGHKEKKSCQGGLFGGFKAKHSCHGATVAPACPTPCPTPCAVPACAVIPVTGVPLTAPVTPVVPAKEMPKPDPKTTEKKSS